MAVPDLRDRLRAALAVKARASSDFDLNDDITAPQTRLTPAAVLFLVRPDDAQVILTKRSARLKHHPGQIAFAGGKQDATDPDLTTTALREAHEEIGLPPHHVDVLGHLPPHQTVTGYQITPVLGLLTQDFTPRPEAGEVSEVFTVPFAHLVDPASYRVEGRRWQGRQRLYYAVPYGPYYIWGATARILRAFADRVA
jgi:8-oxo-dGTP pyrophosphatase MutT (NUDIX family)